MSRRRSCSRCAHRLDRRLFRGPLVLALVCFITLSVICYGSELAEGVPAGDIQGPTTRSPFALFALGQPDVERVPGRASRRTAAAVVTSDAALKAADRHQRLEAQSINPTSATSITSTNHNVTSPFTSQLPTETSTNSTITTPVPTTTFNSMSSASTPSNNHSDTATRSTLTTSSSGTPTPGYRGGLDPSRGRATLPSPTYSPTPPPLPSDLDREVLIRYREAGLTEEQVRALENSGGKVGPPARAVDTWEPIKGEWVWAIGVGGAVGVVGAVVGIVVAASRWRRRERNAMWKQRRQEGL